MGSIGSKVWEPLVPRTGNPRFQDWEALVGRFENLELGPVVPRFGITDDTFGTSLFLERGAGCFWEPKFSELGTRGSKIESIDANVRSKTKWDVNALFGGPLSKTTKTYFKHVYMLTRMPML